MGTETVETLLTQGAAREGQAQSGGGKAAALNWVRTRVYRPSLRLGRRWLGGMPFLREPVRVEAQPDLRRVMEVLHPAEVLDFGDPANDPFLRSCQYIENGRLPRGSVFVCRLHRAVLYPKIGLLLTSRWQPVLESVFDLARFYNFRGLTRPLRLGSQPGAVSSVQHLFSNNHWHWTVDSLAQVWSLEQAMRGESLLLLMPDSLPAHQREHLEMVLPENFSVRYVAAEQWIRCEEFVLPSYVSSRGNAMLPPGYYEVLRNRVFARIGAQAPASGRKGRYYISRSGAAHRRVLNEEAVLATLAPYGFELVRMEHMSFAGQVQLMRGAECIAGPHGAGLACMVYGDALKVLVLYPEARPAGYFYTMARALGHQHFQTNGEMMEDDDFNVEIAQLKRALDEMQLDQPGSRSTRPRIDRPEGPPRSVSPVPAESPSSARPESSAPRS